MRAYEIMNNSIGLDHDGNSAYRLSIDKMLASWKCSRVGRGGRLAKRLGWRCGVCSCFCQKTRVLIFSSIPRSADGPSQSHHILTR